MILPTLSQILNIRHLWKEIIQDQNAVKYT